MRNLSNVNNTLFCIVMPQKGEPVYDIVQILISELVGTCGVVGGGSSQRFDCTFNNNVVSVTCSFDGGEEEDCSLPLVVTTDMFGTDDHFVVLTAIDEFGQRFRTPLLFSLQGKPRLIPTS